MRARRRHGATGTASSPSVSVVINGASGAGKTTLARALLRCWSGVPAGALPPPPPLTAGAAESAAVRVLRAEALLGSFCHAKTVRNDDSSRATKFVQVNFRCHGRGTRVLSGAHFSAVQLDLGRMRRPAAAERNFHVFYQLCFGASGRQSQPRGSRLWCLGVARGATHSAS